MKSSYGICKRELDTEDPKSRDCGGDCWGCVRESEEDFKTGDSMKFKATQEQVFLICLNMINASEVSIGAKLHQRATEESTKVNYKMFLDWFMTRKMDRFDFDYFNGRMVKTCIKRTGEYYPGIEEWEIDCEVPNIEWQSWARVYPTVQSLLDSINIKAY